MFGIPRLATSHCFEALAAQTVRMLEDNLELCNAIDTVSLKSYQKAGRLFLGSWGRRRRSVVRGTKRGNNGPKGLLSCEECFSSQCHLHAARMIVIASGTAVANSSRTVIRF